MTSYFKALDGLRAIAVFLVLLAHAQVPFLRSGGVGVDIFFVLSGFLITGILSKEYQQHQKICRKNFYIRRFLRLSPCLIACLILYAILSLLSGKDIRWDVIAISATYTSNYARALFQYDLDSMSHCWSLAIEEQYYLIWPLVIYWVERTFKCNLIKFILLIAGAMTLAWYRSSVVGIFSSQRIYFGLDTHMDGLVIGSALAYLHSFAKQNTIKDQFYRLLSYAVTPSSIACLVVIIMLTTWNSHWMGRFGFTMVGFASAAIIADLVASPYSLIRRPLEMHVLTYLGKISYGIYLYHVPVYHFVSHKLSFMEYHDRIIFMITASLGVASFSYHFIEKPFLRLKHRFSSDTTARSITPSQ
jgi:peptidoglycan/LPS O-acetylase OafA/YrhL